jgi:hypothetical protein
MNDLDRMRAAAEKIGPKMTEEEAGRLGVWHDPGPKRVPRPEMHVSDDDAWKRINAANNPMHKPTVQEMHEEAARFEGPVGAVVSMPSDPAWKSDLDAAIAKHRHSDVD